MVNSEAICFIVFFFSSRRRHTRFDCDWSSDVCSSDLLDVTLMSTEQLLGTGRAARKPADVAVDEAAEFAARRAEAILNLRPRLEAEMRKLGVDYLFHEIELPLAGVLADMESEGVAIDVPYLKEMQEELGAQMAAIESEVED